MTPIDSPLYGHADMYLAGDEIVSASISDPAATGTSEGLLQPLVGSATSGANKANAITTLLPLTSSSKANNRANSSATLSPLFSAGSNKRYATSTAFMLPITGEAEAEPGVQLITSLGEMQPLWGESSGLTGGVGQSEGAIGPLFVAASEGSYGESSAKIGPLTSLSGENFYKSSGVFASGPTAPHLRANGRSSQGDNSFVNDAPMPTLAAFGGGNAKLRASVAGLSASATGTNFGAAELTAPSPTLEATGTVSGTGSTDPFLAAPMAKLVGYGGALASITLTGKATVQASGTTGSIGRAAITAPLAMLLASATGNNPGNASLRAPGPLLRATGVTGGIGYAAITGPLFELVASGTAQNYGSANLIAPSPQLGATAQAYLIAPMGRLEAIGTATVLVTASSFEAYATNLLHTPREGVPTVDEVTRYTNYPFTHIVRYQGSYFGANSTGLYLLEGTTDDGAPITYDLQTHPDTLGHPAMKTAVSAYLSGRIDPELTAIVVAGEDNPQTYSYDSPRGATAQTHRVKFGRGVKDRYLAIGLSGNGVLELDAIELEISNLKRRI